jgi:hypothetical protein
LAAVNAHHDTDPIQPNDPKESDMATTSSKRSSEKASRPTGGSSSNGGHSDAVRELFVYATRVQLATVTSLSKFVADWAQAADRYAKAISDEVLGRAPGETTSRELVGRLAVLSRRHLRELTDLPTDAVGHFNSELARRPQQQQRVVRRAA